MDVQKRMIEVLADEAVINLKQVVPTGKVKNGSLDFKHAFKLFIDELKTHARVSVKKPAHKRKAKKTKRKLKTSGKKVVTKKWSKTARDKARKRMKTYWRKRKAAEKKAA